MGISTWLPGNHNILSVGFSALSFCVAAAAFWRSGLSLALARRAEDRARESVRPFIGTGLHAATGDMQVTLSNYGAGVAIIHRISFRREGAAPEPSLIPFLSESQNYELTRRVYFVQELYYIRPGGTLIVASAKVRKGRSPDDAVKDWARDIEGIQLDVQYSDILKREFAYNRLLSANPDLHSNVSSTEVISKPA
jgi:hypothetical protein